MHTLCDRPHPFVIDARQDRHLPVLGRGPQDLLDITSRGGEKKISSHMCKQHMTCRSKGVKRYPGPRRSRKSPRISIRNSRSRGRKRRRSRSPRYRATTDAIKNVRVERDGDVWKVFVNGVLKETVKHDEEKYFPVGGSYAKVNSEGVHFSFGDDWVLQKDGKSMFDKLDQDSFGGVVYELLKSKANVSTFAKYFKQHQMDLEQTLREPASLFQARRLGYVNDQNEVIPTFHDKVDHDDFNSELVELRKQVQRDLSSSEPSSRRLLYELAFDLPSYIKRTNPSTYDVGIHSPVLQTFGGTLTNPTLREVDGSQHNLDSNDRIIFRDMPRHLKHLEGQYPTVTPLYIIRADDIIRVAPGQTLQTRYLHDTFWGYN